MSECVEHSDQSILPPPVIPERNASIREEGNERAELVAVRKETREEYAVHHASSIRESILISLAFLLLFISLMTPLAVIPWLAAAAMLLHTPFSAKGVITQLSTDANGTQHINLRSDPDAITLWRYFGTGLLMLVLSVVLVANLALMLVKMRKSQQRERDIKQYYDACFSTRLATPILMEGRAYRMND